MDHLAHLCRSRAAKKIFRAVDIRLPQFAVMPQAKVLLALGKGAHDQILRALTVRPVGAYPFIHNKLHKLPTGLMLADSYHCSRYNTNTGVLTPQMFREVFGRVRGHLDAAE